MARDEGIAAPTALGLPRAARPRSGFSLIEVLAVVLLTVLVIGVTANTYVDLSRATQRAVEGTRQLRHAMSVLDRVARDLQAAVLVAKPEELDPLAHPWLFLAESRFSSEGSDQIKFMTRGRSLRADEGERRESDFQVLAYLLVEGEVEGDGLYELRRWSSPRLPEGLDREFPEVEDSQLVAGNVERFRLRFLSEAGDWQESWDSSQLEDSGALPISVEIEVALFDEYASSVVDVPGGAAAARAGEAVAPGYQRMVVLPLRPIDLAKRFEPGDGDGDGAGGEGDEDEAKGEAFGPELPGGGGQARARPDRTVASCLQQPLPDNCLSLGEPRILSQPFEAASRHVQALIECGARVLPACR